MKKILFFLCFLAANYGLFAQSELKVFPDWLSTTGSQYFFYKNVTKIDASNNVYVAGATVNGSGNYDILIAKYNSSGVQQWIQQYNGAGNGDDIATALFVDANSNVYITGAITTATNIDAVTIKYNSSGVQQWLSTYNGTGSAYDCGADISVDASGNVYITGSSYNASYNTDILAIKYNSSGTQQFATQYNYTSNMNDAAVKIAIGTNIVTSGLVQTGTSAYKYCAVTFNISTGAFIGIKSSSTATSTGIDVVSDMVEDAAGNIYIAGGTPVAGQGYNYDIIKLNSSNLSLAWERTYNTASNLDDIATGIKVDASGNVYVTGTTSSSSQGKNITTIKYNSAGTQQWVQTYNNSLNTNEEANSMALDASGNVYITGYVDTEVDGSDYFTLKYDASGNNLWTIHNDGDAHLDDISNNIAIDNNGDILVTGQSETAPGVYQYCTVKYLEKQIITPADGNSESPATNFDYYENKGQIINTSGATVPAIRYYTNNSYPAYYIKKNSFGFLFSRTDTNATINDTLHRIDLTFDNVNSASKTYAMNEKPDYLNYFLGHCPAGITEIHGNQRLVTTELYPNIDLIYSSNQNGIKYYFIIKPGGELRNLNMTYTGASSFNLDGTTNSLTINSSIGSVTFERPTAYQLSSTNTVIPITNWQCAWQTNGASNKYKFFSGSYDVSKTLVIQVDLGHSTYSPNANGNLDWSTYYGGNKDDEFYKIKTDAKGKIYVTGFTLSTGNLFPTSVGALYGNSLGAADAIILKFDTSGARKWGTYYGGDLNDLGYSIAVDASGYVYISGSTNSTNFPINTLSGAYMQSTNGGSGDAFIVKLDSLGRRETGTNARTWSTYFGGNGLDKGLDLKFDRLNNLYIVGKGTSTSPHVNQTGSYNNMSNGTGLIAKFNPGNALIWSAIYAGTEEIKSLAIEIDTGKSVFIVGSANSNLLPIVQPTTFSYIDSTFNSGGTDAFIANFSPGGAIIWSTYYGGSGADVANAITINNTDEFYITGNTHSSDFPHYYTGYPAYIDSTNGGNDDIFILKFHYRWGSEGGARFYRRWSTLYGGNGIYESGNDIVTDYMGSIYVTGSTSSNSFPLQSLNNGYNDGSYNSSNAGEAYMLAFSASLSRLWSVYFGGNGNDCGWGLAVDNLREKLYLTGTTSSQTSDFPLQGNSPAWMQWLNGDGGVGYYYSDGFISRFYLSPVIISSGIDDDESISINNDFIIYPNPSNGDVTLEILFDKPENISISLYNIMGEKVYDETVNNAFGLFQKNISFTSLSAGIYIVKVKSENYSISKKIIKH
jgi:uncharacterized delta-60 repeat protein